MALNHIELRFTTSMLPFICYDTERVFHDHYSSRRVRSTTTVLIQRVCLEQDATNV